MIREFEDIGLLDRNTLAIDVRCRRLAEFETTEDLYALFSDKSVAKGSWYVLAGGSNILFTGDYDGTLLHSVNTHIEIVSETPSFVRVRAGAGADWDSFVEWCVERGLWGAENLSLIPGLVGASPVQNIGAYGCEAKDIIESVEMFSAESLSTVTLAREHCAFGYRDSVFKHSLKGRVVITAVNFILGKLPAPNTGYGDLRDKVESLGGPTLENIRNAVIAIRRAKLPDPAELPNAGSFFKNPVVDADLAAALKERYPSMPLYPSGRSTDAKLAAGWLIEQSGWKGRRVGNVGMHDKQALVLVNYGGATGREILGFAAEVSGSVYENFGVEITPEVNIL